MDQNIFFTMIQQIYIFFQLLGLGHQIIYFSFTLELFQLDLEGNYLLQEVAATNYLFLPSPCLKLFISKISLRPPPEIKWWLPLTRSRPQSKTLQQSLPQSRYRYSRWLWLTPGEAAWELEGGHISIATERGFWHTQARTAKTKLDWET